MSQTISCLFNKIFSATIKLDNSISIYSFHLQLMDYYIAKNIVLIINVLICASYPFNFAIYCGMSK